MSNLDLNGLVQELREVVRQDKPIKKVRDLVAEAFHDFETIRTAMPDYENDDEIRSLPGGIREIGC